MMHVALVGAAALAGAGFAGLTADLRGRGLAVATTAALVVAALECHTPAFRTTPAPPPARLDAVYDWLAGQPPDVRIVELPIDEITEADAINQYASTGHWKRTLGGTMGIVPPAYPYMVRELRRFPDRDVLASLDALGITHAVVHGRLLPAAARAALAGRVAEAGPLLERVYARDDTAVYAIRPGRPTAPEPPHGRRLAPEAWRATASHDAAHAAQAIDGDPHTSWGSWGELEEGLRTRWYDAVPFLTRWQRWLEGQPAWLRVDLGAPTAIGAVVLHLVGTDPHALPALAVEGSLDGVAWQRLPGELRPLPDVRALVERAAAPELGVLLPLAREARLLRVVCTGLEWRLAEVEVYAP
jgi:hypothetical protein